MDKFATDRLARLVLDLRNRSLVTNEESSEWIKGRASGYCLAAKWLEEILHDGVHPGLEAVERWTHKLSAYTELHQAMPTVEEAMNLYREAVTEGLLEVPNDRTT